MGPDLPEADVHLRRARLVTILAALSSVLFAIGDVLGPYAFRSALVSMKVCELAALFGVWRLLHAPASARRRNALAIAAAGIVALATAASGIVVGDPLTTPALAGIIAMAVAILMPWGVREQTALTLLLIVASGLNLLAVDERFGLTRMYLLAGSAMGMGVALFVTYELAGYRRALAQRTRELEGARGLSRSIIESSPAGILAFDRSYRYTLWNPAMERISGMKAEETLGRTAFEVFPFLREIGEDRFFSKALAGTSSRTEDRVYRVPETGREGFFSGDYSPLRDAEGNVVGGLTIVNDVTERRHSEDARARLAAIVEASDDAIIGYDVDGTVRSWNHGAEMLFGYPAGEIVGSSIGILIPEDRRHELEDVLRRLRAGERIAGFETARKRKDGSLVEISLTLSPIRNSLGEVVSISGVARDIGANKAVQRMRQDFVAMLSHDMKNPLAVVVNFAELLRDPSLTTEERDDALSRIEAAARRALDLAVNFVDASRLESGALKAQPKPGALNEVVETTVAQLATLARPRKIAIDLRLAPALPVASLDVRLIERLLTNLIDNAIRYSPEGGRVTVRTSYEDRALRLRVSDQGPGIPPEQREAVFLQYTQLGKKRSGTSGLGLFIVRKIVEAHGGRISVGDSERGGAAFEVTLPVETSVGDAAPARTGRPSG